MNTTLKFIYQSIQVGFTMALIEMKNHLLRSILSITGIMLGVASLIIMLTLIGGIDVFLNQKMIKWVGSVWFWKKYDPSENEKFLWSRSPGIHLKDTDYLQKNSSLVKDIPLEITRNVSFSFQNQSIAGHLRGVDLLTLELDSDDIVIDYGKYIDKNDFISGTMNCIISWEIAESIVESFKFSSKSNLIGKSISTGRNQFTIKGIYALKNNDDSPWHFRRGIIIPLKTMLSKITGLNPESEILHVRLNNIDNIKEKAKRVSIKLKEKHRGIEDFEYRTAEWLDEITKMLNNISILMGAISLLSLSVGGLSIMNVMLSSISERIQEIGTRKALGANNFQIFIQFITETTTLSITGGLFGMLIGCIPLFFKKAILKSTDGVIEPTILLNHLLFSTSLIIVIGIIFGLYPAIKACRMNPTEALRYE